ncbi:hypothetical protein [Phycicoccus duodecadis]|uniref:hypothetical protein n=1 Tax=Phycicoccus duodecadis TaxID=173053 RepID=UPI000C7010CE|nr:hypothetical protein [Phycicoccus duodecadis]
MDRGQLSSRIAAARAEVAALGRALVEHGRGLDAAECYELAGEAQKLANAADGLVSVSAALGLGSRCDCRGTVPSSGSTPSGTWTRWRRAWSRSKRA